MFTPVMWTRAPIVALLVGEAITLNFTIRADSSSLPITPLAATGAILCLLVGLWPLVIRPSATTRLSAWLSILLAGFVLIPMRPGILARPPAGMLLWSLSPFGLHHLLHGVLLAAAAFHVAAHLPADLPTPACPRPAAWIISSGYGGGIIILTAFLLAPNLVRGVLLASLLLWCYGLIGGAVWRLACLSRRPIPAQPQAAQQARVLLGSALVAAVPTLLLTFLELLWGAALVRADLGALFLVLFPLGAAYTILRHDLLLLDSALRRTLAYTALSAVALSLYFGLTLLLTIGVVRRWPEFTNLAAVLSILLTTLAFAPLHARVQTLVDRWLYPERRTLQQAIAAARTTLGQVFDRAAVVTLLTQQLPAAIDASWASLTLSPAPATPGPQPTPPAWQTALVVGTTEVGRYWLGPRRTLPTYDSDESAQLAQLLQEAALVLAYAATIAALQALNQELETRVAQRTAQVVSQQRALAAHAERQALARNLHDSITQALFSLNLSLRAIRKVAARDPQAALDHLADQEVVAQQALTEMRALLAQLRSSEPGPGEATMIDLVDRLYQLCVEQQRHSPLQVALETPATFFCPAPVAQELLAIVREALHNIVKHSGVNEATCTLTVDAQTICLAVVDHGQGFNLTTALGKSTDGGTIKGSNAAVGHYGLRGMQERSAAIGGQLDIHSSPGNGMAVTLRLPRQQYSSGLREQQI
ncbi:MAG: histidine kinase [Caldilineaceae bacterium]